MFTILVLVLLHAPAWMYVVAVLAAAVNIGAALALFALINELGRAVARAQYAVIELRDSQVKLITAYQGYVDAVLADLKPAPNTSNSADGASAPVSAENINVETENKEADKL